MLKSLFDFKKILFLLILFSQTGNVNSQSLKEPSVIALLTLNVVRFTHWPVMQSNDFHLCVIGDSIVQDAFLALDGARVGEKKVSIDLLTRLRKIDRCQAIFIDNVEPLILKQILKLTLKQLILTVGRGRSFVEAGGVVAIDIVNKKPKLLINLFSCNYSAYFTKSIRSLSKFR